MTQSSGPDQRLKSPSSSSINFVSGAFAAGLATAITNPFDAVKTRLQLMPGKYGNMMRAVRLMIHEDGVRSLFGGLGLRIGRKALSSALAWTVYEELILRAETRWAKTEMGI
jgi:solute carrier family 25 protein 38